MRTKLITLCLGGVVASACAARLPPPRAGSVVDPGNASSFWCGSSGQCFTDERECSDDSCFPQNYASCAVYQDGDDPRFMCGVDAYTCSQLRDQLLLRDVGECRARSVLSPDVATAALLHPAAQPQQPQPPVDQPIMQPSMQPAVQPAPPPVVQPAPQPVAEPTPPPAPAPQPAVVTIAPPEHRYWIPQKTVDDIKIGAVPAGVAGWKIRITNNTEDTVLVVWDESTFVTSSRESGGRLLRNMKKLDAQPPTPIAPHSRITETVFIEKLLAAEDEDDDLRESVRDLIIGGHMALTLQLPDGKQSWTGDVESADELEKAATAP
jgi:hypothetical protein